MGTNNNYRVVMLLVVAVAFGFSLMPYARAQEWTLTGNVIDGSTCTPLVNATVSSPFNSNASTQTNVYGNYTLLLGFGSWNVTISKAGYTSITFNTPYESSGAYKFDTYLLAPGTVAVNCTTALHASNSTVPTTATTATTASTLSTVPQSNQQNNQSSTGLLEAGLGVLVVIIIIAIAFFAMKGKKSGKQEQKDEKKDEKKS